MKTDTDTIKKRYNRLAPFFDGIEALFEGLFFQRWRQQLWQQVEGEHILEVGVGTGKNFPFYPTQAQISAIDFSDKMLARAQQKRDARNINVYLELMDVESLYYASNCFDTVLATFVFCSVPQPRKGLKELHRVCRPGGKVVLLEHVLSSNKLMAKLMNKLNPLVLKLLGANINRQTVKTVQGIGFKNVYVTHLNDMVKLIVAVK